jgi:hypothetical protein
MMDMHSVAYLKVLLLAGLNKTIKLVGGGKSLDTIKTVKFIHLTGIRPQSSSI